MEKLDLDIDPLSDDYYFEVSPELEKLGLFNNVERNILFKDIKLLETHKNVRIMVATCQKIVVNTDEGKELSY